MSEPIRRLPVGDLARALGEPLDLFVGCVSYEARCSVVADALNPAAVQSALIAENINHASTHGNFAEHLLTRFGPSAARLDISTEDPLKTADSLFAGLASKREAKRVLIDVTTFTHEALLILLRIVAETLCDADVQFVYAGASEYSIGDPPERKWLSRGIKTIRSVLGYPGILIPTRRLHLVLLAGFEHERATELVRWYEPSVISLGYGKSSEPGADVHHLVNRHRFDTLRSFFPTAFDFEFECFDFERTCSAVITQAGLMPDHNVIVAAMNTKISTIGAAVAASVEPRIQLCYSQALLYNTAGYSRPNHQCYLFRLAQLCLDDQFATMHAVSH
jgi:hypothetical protein